LLRSRTPALHSLTDDNGEREETMKYLTDEQGRLANANVHEEMA
jgi:hypothetical protein